MNAELQPQGRPERAGWPHPASFGAGAFFALAGILFLLEQLELLQLSTRVLWPLLLIILGLALIAEELVARMFRGPRHDTV
jgi:hypothetical protein